MYKIKISKDVARLLKKCPQYISQKFREKTIYMKNDAFDPRCDIVKIVNTQNDWRLRVGDYRFFFTIIDHDITIYFFDAGARGDVYKK